MDTVNISTHLKDRARRHPDQQALLLPDGRDSANQIRYTRLTYQKLDQISDILARELQQAGVGRGTRTVLMVPPSLEFFGLTFGLFKAGAVSVFVDPGMGIRNIGKCLDEAAPEAFIGIPKAHLARRLMGWGASSLKCLIATGKGAKWCRWLGRNILIRDVAQLLEKSAPDPEPPNVVDCQPRIAQTTADEMAAILFTSGSTGVPKGAVYSHGNFAAQIEMLRDAFSIEPGEVDLCTFPLFALFAPALGMTAVVPRMDFTRPARVDPREIALPIQQHGVANLFGSPALLNRVGRFYAQTDVQWPTVRRVLSAGAPVSPQIIERFAARLSPDAQIFTPYGATESLPVAVIGSREILDETRHKTAEGAGTCVGRPVEQMDVAIIQITDGPIAEWNASLQVPQGEIGEIVVSGPNVTQSYFNRPDLTALAKIPDPASGRARHRMGDVGYLDEQGRLWFCGRKSHRVVTSTRTYFTEPVEGVFNAHPAVYRSAVVGVEHAGELEPVLCIEREAERRGNLPDDQLTRELLQLGARYDHTRDIRKILYHQAFPVDIRHNSKIFREKLAIWAQARLNDRARIRS